MKTALIKRSLALLLCGTLLAGTTACGKPSSPSAGTTPSNTTSQDNTATDFKYEPALDVSFVKWTDDYITRNVCGPLGETVEQNRWLQNYYDQIGVNVKYDWVVDSSQYEQKLKLSMSKGDIPDVLFVSIDQMSQLVSAGKVQPLDGLFEQYASEETKKQFDIGDPTIWQAATFDGKVYGIPNIYTPYDRLQYLWIRQDWLDKLGLEAPKTMEDLFKISTAFTKQDPDGNGKDDTYGLGIDKNLYDSHFNIKGFLNGYHVVPNRTVKLENGTFTRTEIDDNLQAPLTQLNKMYANGEIDPQFGTKDANALIESIGQNKVGMFYAEHWAPTNPLGGLMEQLQKTSPDAEWTVVAIPSIDAEPAKQNLDLGCNGWFVVNKDFQHPEALIKMINVFWDTFVNGDRTVYFDNDQVSGIFNLSPINMLDYNNNPYYYNLTLPVVRGEKDSSELPAHGQTQWNLMKNWYANKDYSQWAWCKIYGEGGAISVLAENYIPNDTFLRQDYVKPQPQVQTDLGPVVKQLTDTYIIKTIIGEQSAADFGAYKEQWLKSGGQQILDALNAA